MLGRLCVYFCQMGRGPRHLPTSVYGRTLVELTSRTIQGRCLLRPSGRLSQITIGVLARAQGISGAQVHAFTFLSNHCHLLASFTDSHQMAAFEWYLKGNLAREVNRLHDWSGTFWHDRYRPISVSDEPEVQLGRLKYVLAQGCLKEGLVASPLDWPGATSSHALFNGYRTMTGIWVDRASMYRARKGDEQVTEAMFTSQETLELSPLPAFADLGWRAYTDRARELVEVIEAETRARNRVTRRAPLGAQRVREVHPHSRPKELERSPAPRFHAKSRKVWRAMRDELSEFLRRYREAAARLKAGELDVAFPQGCFPPRPPFTHPKLVPD